MSSADTVTGFSRFAALASAMSSAMDERSASLVISANMYSCNDFPSRAARAVSTLRTSSGTFRMVIVVMPLT